MPWRIFLSAGQTVANAAFAELGADGRICLFSERATHLIVDVNGVFPAESLFTPWWPARLADTRAGGTTVDGQFAGGGKVPAGGVLELPVAGRDGVPADADAVALNVTVTEPDTAGYVTVWPCGFARPNASNLNYAAGQTVANAVFANARQAPTRGGPRRTRTCRRTATLGTASSAPRPAAEAGR